MILGRSEATVWQNPISTQRAFKLPGEWQVLLKRKMTKNVFSRQSFGAYNRTWGRANFHKHSCEKRVSAVLFKWNLLMKSLFVYPPLLIFCPVTWQSAYRKRSGLVRWQTSIPEAFPDEDGSDESVMTPPPPPPGGILAAAKQQRFLLLDKLDNIQSDISRCFQSQTQASAKASNVAVIFLCF